MKVSSQVAEQKIADALFLRHGQVLNRQNVDGVYVGLEFVDVRSASRSYFSRPTGKVQIRVGPQFGDRTLKSVGFKEKKDGTHSYEKIADKLNGMYERTVRRNTFKETTEQLVARNSAARKKILEDRGLSEYSGALNTNWETGAMTFKVNVNPDQAEKFVDLAKELGLVS